MKLILPLLVLVGALAFFAGVVSAYHRVTIKSERGLVRQPTSFCPSAVTIGGARKQPYCVEV